MISTMRKVTKYLVLFSVSVLVLGGCSEKREVTDLVDNKGIFLTNGAETTLPILSLIELDSNLALNKTYDEGIRFFAPKIEEYLFDDQVPINRFSLEITQLMLDRNYQKPVIIQVDIGTGIDGSILWSYEWIEDEPIIFDITHQFNDNFPDAEVLGMVISIFKLDEEDIITEVESYFMAIQNVN